MTKKMCACVCVCVCVCVYAHIDVVSQIGAGSVTRQKWLTREAMYKPLTKMEDRAAREV